MYRKLKKKKNKGKRSILNYCISLTVESAAHIEMQKLYESQIKYQNMGSLRNIDLLQTILYKLIIIMIRVLPYFKHLRKIFTMQLL